MRTLVEDDTGICGKMWLAKTLAAYLPADEKMWDEVEDTVERHVTRIMVLQD